MQALVVFLRANDAVSVRLEVLGSPLASQLEAVDYRLIKVNFWRQHNRCSVRLQEHLSDRRAKTSAIKSRLVLRDVNFVALRAVDFDAAGPHFVTEPDRQGFLLVTECARTQAILSRQVTMIKDRHAFNILSESRTYLLGIGCSVHESQCRDLTYPSSTAKTVHFANPPRSADAWTTLV